VGQKLWIPKRRKTNLPPPKDNNRIQTLFIWPVKGEIINRFSKTSREIHPGIDIAAPLGSSIVASRAGKVIFSGDGPGTLGKTIIIDHTGGYTTIYAYNLENLVLVNQEVKKGERIGLVGTPLKSSTSALHFEIRKNTVPCDPLVYLPKTQTYRYTGNKRQGEKM
jgi:murein DD-endopeptidase MepM/ murein hydrolase activator NlpD